MTEQFYQENSASENCKVEKKFENDHMALQSDKKQAETGMRSTLGRMEPL